MASKEEWEARRRGRIPRSTPVRDVLERMFPTLPALDKDRVSCLLESKGISTAADFRGHRHWSGQLVDWGVPQWISKALVSKELVDPGMPKDVCDAARKCAGLDLSPDDAKFEEDGLFGSTHVSRELQLRLQAEMARWDSWLHLALEGFDDPEEKALVTNLFKPEEVAVMYGFRALLRIIMREAPARYRMIATECFIGSFYFVNSLVEFRCDDGDSLDWSKVVWMLQVSSEEVHYGEAVGRMILGVRKMFHSQPARELAFGVVAACNLVHVYAFRKPTGDEELMPSYVDKWMFTYDSCHTGFELLVHLLCVAPAVHGFHVEDFLQDFTHLEDLGVGEMG